MKNKIEKEHSGDSKASEILKWLKHYQDPHVIVTEEVSNNLKEFINRVLKLNNYNVDMSKYFLVQFLKSHCRSSNAPLFRCRNSESDEILQSCQSEYLFPVPFPTNDGGRLTVMKLAYGSQIENFNQEAFFKRFLMISDMRLMEEPLSTIDYFLIDFEGLTKIHFIKLLHGRLWLSFLRYLKEFYPRRLGKIYIINSKFWQKNLLTLCFKKAHIDKDIISNVIFYPGTKTCIDDLKLVSGSIQSSLQDFNDLGTKKLILQSDWFNLQDKLLALFSAETFGEENISSNINLFDKSTNEIYVYKNLEGIFRSIEIS